MVKDADLVVGVDRLLVIIPLAVIMQTTGLRQRKTLSTVNSTENIQVLGTLGIDADTIIGNIQYRRRYHISDRLPSLGPLSRYSRSYRKQKIFLCF